MANDINRVTLIGRFTRDPELKFTPNNTPISNFSLASNYSYTSNGEKKEQVSFFNDLCWGKGGQIISQYMKKGSRIIVEGRLQQRSWEDKNGNKRSIVEVVVENFQFLDSGKSDGNSSQTENSKEPENVPGFDELPDNTFSDEDIPF